MTLDSNFSERLNRFIDAAPGEIVIDAGFLDRGAYTNLHSQLLLKNREAAKKLGRPGKSDMERGFGAIANIPEQTRDWARRNGPQFGLNIDDDWYVTPLGHDQRNPHKYLTGREVTAKDLMDAAFGELHHNFDKGRDLQSVKTNADLTDIPLSDEVIFSDPPVEAPSPHGANPQLSDPQPSLPNFSEGIGTYAQFVPQHNRKSGYSMPTSEYLDALIMHSNPEELVKAGEGTRLNKKGEHIVYLDGLGNKTGGHGHLITEGDYEVGDVIPINVVNKWFEDDYREHEQQMIKDLSSSGTDLGNMSDTLYSHLVDFTFNQGSFRKWPTLRKQIAAGDWEGAAENVWSDWFTSYENEVGRDFEMGDGTYDRKLRLTLAFLQEAARS